MGMKSAIIYFLLFCIQFSAYGETSKPNIEYSKPKAFDFITGVPQSLKEGWAYSFNTKSNTLWAWAGVLSSSTIFYVYDEKIYKHFKIFARNIGLGNDDHTKPMIRMGKINVFRGPTDLGSAMYFIGDGWLQTFTAATFAIHGAISDDNRALQTASQIMKSLIAGSIPTQIIKRATGREDPNRTSAYRGAWRPFNKNYSKDVSAYDAVPSGHIMAVTSTLTVIDSNYPEYRSIIRPLGFTLLTLVGFQMVNIGVHWVSDYPLGMAIGYVFGKTASSHGRNIDSQPLTSSWEILPVYSTDEKRRSIFGALGILNF